MAQRPSNLRGVIFDMDGCLVDSEPLCLNAIAEEFQSLGIRDVTAADIGERFLGVAISKIEDFAASRLGHPVPAGFATRIEDQLVDIYQRELQHIPGAETLLDRLAQSGFGLGLATGASLRRMQATLEISGLGPRFGARAVSVDNVARGKPAPDIFLEAALRLDLPPTACIVVEDSPHGVKGALKAGMAAIGFVGGSHLKTRKAAHAQVLQEAGAAEIFEDLGALCDFILSAQEAKA
ncbi:MAG: HAD family hydrolase [Mangrovicoccus sp.]